MTARLSLPYIAPQQAQKQVTYNEAMALLDRLVQPSVISRTTSAPPGTPGQGDTYIVAPSASGAWSGKDGQLATWLDGGWAFVVPGEGWLAYVMADSELVLSQSGAWSSLIAAETFETGDWTPDVAFGGATTGITYASRLGRFTRAGNQVAIRASLTLTAKGSATGAAQIGGLPFTARDDGLPAAMSIGFAAGFTGVVGAVLGQIKADSDAASLFQSANGVAVVLTDAEFTNGATLSFAATYERA